MIYELNKIYNKWEGYTVFDNIIDLCLSDFYLFLYLNRLSNFCLTGMLWLSDSDVIYIIIF